MLYSANKPSSPYSIAFLVVLTGIALAAGVYIVLEALRLQPLRPGVASTSAMTFGLMLASLAGVVLSVILPERLGKAILLLGALGFFACLGVALIFGIRV
jgi:hypothetical protein